MTHPTPSRPWTPSTEEIPRGPYGAGCWSDIMAAEVEEPEVSELLARLPSGEPEPPHPPPD